MRVRPFENKDVNEVAELGLVELNFESFNKELNPVKLGAQQSALENLVKREACQMLYLRGQEQVAEL